MIGRGAIKNPALFREIQGGKPLRTEELIKFTNALSDNYNKVLDSDTFTLHKLKEIWTYMIQNFSGECKVAKKIKKTSKLSEFLKFIEKLPEI